MELTLVAVLLLGFLLLVLALGLWIGLGLLVTGAAAIAFLTPAPVGTMAATAIWGDSNDWTLTALPMFLWMGDILFRTRVSEGLFKGLAPWLAWAPGRLLWDSWSRRRRCGRRGSSPCSASIWARRRAGWRRRCGRGD